MQQPASPVASPPSKPPKPSVRYEQSPLAPAQTTSSPAEIRRKPPVMPRPAGNGLATKRPSSEAPTAVKRPVQPEVVATPAAAPPPPPKPDHMRSPDRSEEHTSELQSLMRTSYAVFCLKKK